MVEPPLLDSFDLGPSDNSIHTTSRSHSFLGFTWWTSRATVAYGYDICGPRTFWSIDVDKGEARAVEWAKQRFGRLRNERSRRFPA